ncbi:MAG: stage III sporulation protein AA [Ruminococcaceae bacterium]|nr:stage III sporulation protein AA [Oscillospiraceae bacterium]
MQNTKEIIIRQLSEPYRTLLSPVSFDGLEEIRFRIGQPVTLYYYNRTVFLNESGHTNIRSTGRNDLEALSACLCNHSVYAYLNEIKDGFITIRGGHRVGLAGKCVEKNGRITGISSISGINLRIAREYKNCAKDLLPHLHRIGGIQNTLLLSPPQCGKTTYLRDIARLLSADYKITVVDERSEIAGTYDGIPQFDLGPQTDVLDRFPKAEGMLLALRSLSPQILITDELGDDRDIEAIKKLYGAGCRIIATMHGDSLTDLSQAKKDMLSYFNLILLMGRQNNKPAVSAIKQLR